MVTKLLIIEPAASPDRLFFASCHAELVYTELAELKDCQGFRKNRAVLNKTMNYFEIFGLPVQLKVDKTALPKKYFELSKKFHPDFYANATPSEQHHALEITANLNKAYKTFQNEDETIKYVLQLKNLVEEEEKYQLPPDFLMEVLEINENLMDASGDTETKLSLQSSIDNLQSEIYEPVKEIIEHYQDGVTSEKELLQVKEYYYKKKYLHRIQQQLNGMS
jgi:molecular chaperone HscB